MRNKKLLPNGIKHHPFRETRVALNISQRKLARAIYEQEGVRVSGDLVGKFERYELKFSPVKENALVRVLLRELDSRSVASSVSVNN